MAKLVMHLLNSSSYSGAENVAISIIKNVDAFSDYKSIYVSKLGEIEKQLKGNSISYKLIKKNSFINIWKLCKEYGPSIVHAHDFRASILSAFLIGKYSIISHLHHNPPWMHTVNFKSVSYLLTSMRFKKILVVSDEVINGYIFAKYIKSKVVCIGNPINLSVTGNKSVINEIKSHDLVFLGRLEDVKDPIRFLRIAKDLILTYPQITVGVLGDGSLRDECIKYVTVNNLSNNVHFYGFVDDPISILSKSRILCITSKWEGFGLAAVEGMSCGLPVVASNNGGLRSFIDTSCGKLCDSDEEMINEISELLLNSTYYQNKSRGAIEKATRMNNIEEYTKKIIEIYDWMR